MKYLAEITQVSTGVTRTYHATCDWCIDSGGYLWSEGNYSCDCNRGIFFAYAGGEEPKWDSDCSEGKYRVVCKSEDGAVLYADDP